MPFFWDYVPVEIRTAPVRAEADASTVKRLPALDGLRGVAALVVAIHHSLLAVPALAQPYYEERQPASLSLGAITHTPLHLLWAGTEAVYVFFVLSGLVLTLPVAGNANYPWRTYYPRRLVRLYLPVFASVLFGVALALAVPRDSSDGLSQWLQNRPADVTPKGLVKDLTLVGGVSRLVSPLWSLQWEVLFSLALPLYLIVALRIKGPWAIKAAAVLGATTVGALTGVQFLIYLPMFAAGVLLSVNLAALTAWVGRLSQRVKASLLAAALLLCSSHAGCSWRSTPVAACWRSRPRSSSSARRCLSCWRLAGPARRGSSRSRSFDGWAWSRSACT